MKELNWVKELNEAYKKNILLKEENMTPLPLWASRVDMSNPRHRAAKDIHNAWMQRNPRGDWNKHQHVPYEDLSDEEQEKDGVHVDTIMDISKGIIADSPEDHRHLSADAFGAKAHEAWRKGFDSEGTGKARMKKVSDGSEVNINVPWEELHPEWKKENYEAGLAAYDAMSKHFKEDRSAEDYRD